MQLSSFYPVNVIRSCQLFFTGSDSFSTYGGVILMFQVKQPKVLKFQPLREALTNPGEFLFSDFAKFDRPPLLHLGFQALDAFRAEAGHFPAPASDSDAAKLIELAHSINEKQPSDHRLESIDDSILKLLASGSRAVLSPMAAMFGGIVGQEVVKACSGKFHPLYQVCNEDLLFTYFRLFLFVSFILFTSNLLPWAP